MNPFYAASVPVFRHYLVQVAGMIEQAGEAALEARISDAWPAGRQFGAAAGFALRIACPLAGREVPNLPAALAPRMAVARARLGALVASDFEGAQDRMITHQAGLVEITQTAQDFLFLYGLPNFFFHVSMGYAALRAAGLPLGKGDFDNFHHYPEGFAFDP